MKASKKTTEMLKMVNHDLETAYNKLEESLVIDYIKDREYLMNVIKKVFTRNSNFLSENIVELVREGAE